MDIKKQLIIAIRLAVIKASGVPVGDGIEERYEIGGEGYCVIINGGTELQLRDCIRGMREHGMDVELPVELVPPISFELPQPKAGEWYIDLNKKARFVICNNLQIAEVLRLPFRYEKSTRPDDDYDEDEDIY